MLKIEIPLVAKDILTDGEKSNLSRQNCQALVRHDPCHWGLLQVASVLFAAIDASSSTEAETWKRRWPSLYGTTYPFWFWITGDTELFQNPFVDARLVAKPKSPVLQTVIGWRLWVRYITSTLIGLTFPVFIFNRIENRLYARIKAS